MSYKSRISNYFKRIQTNPWCIFWKLNYTKIQRVLPDEVFLKIMFRARMGTHLDLNNPKTFNEKLQWLKLNDRNPQYTQMVDKYEAKTIIEAIAGSQYIIPTYGVWNSFSEIDFNALPNEFVLKTTHDAGRIIICKDKKELNLKDAKKKLDEGLKTNFFWQGREWPYKNVRPRIIAEKLLKNDDGSELMDYKIMCFNGKAYCCFVCTGRGSREGLRVTFFDRDWNRLPFVRHYPCDKNEIQKPINYQKMISLAEEISKDMAFLRVDFYEVNNDIYIGELTFFPGNGFEEFSPPEWDYKLGEMLKLGIK